MKKGRSIQAERARIRTYKSKRAAEAIQIAREARERSEYGQYGLWLIEESSYRDDQRLELEALAGPEDFWGPDTIGSWPTPAGVIRGYWKRTMMGGIRLRQMRYEEQGINQGQPDHGTRTRYRYGCRCDACREAAVAYARQLRERSRKVDDTGQPS